MNDTIQQQLITARKNQILDAAALVFSEKGFHPTTIRDIARRAGIADGTIYNYFDSKPALLLGIFDRMRTAVIGENPPIAPEDLPTFIRMTVTHPLMALKADNFALFRIIISEMMVNEELRGLYYAQIIQPALIGAELFLSQRLGQREHIDLLVRTISATILGLMTLHIMGDSTLTAEWEKIPDVVTDLLLNGLKDTDK
jgi:AcrR family transcriptional regulator